MNIELLRLTTAVYMNEITLKYWQHVRNSSSNTRTTAALENLLLSVFYEAVRIQLSNQVYCALYKDTCTLYKQVLFPQFTR